jgi:hypothetical protein
MSSKLNDALERSRQPKTHEKLAVKSATSFQPTNAKLLQRQ